MESLQFLLLWGVIGACVFQLWRTPRLWAFLFLFIVIFPKIALVTVPGETTPIRVDDVVMAAVLGWWILKLFLGRRPTLPATAGRWANEDASIGGEKLAAPTQPVLPNPLRARDGRRDVIRCGKNSYDSVDSVDADRVDVVASDCELVRRH